MDHALVFITVYVVMQLLLLVLIQKQKIMKLEEQKERLRQDVLRQDLEFKRYAEHMQAQIDKIMKAKIKGSGAKPDVPLDTINAVKYAMKHSHPDNGGDAADFMRFRKVYKELARK